MAKKLKTGWVILATSGASVDGRIIEKDWLKEMAKHYNPKLFNAKIFPDHYRWMPTGGSVLALKTQKSEEPELEGEIHLMGILAPNDWLIEANRQGQLTHASIEVKEDFMGKGFCYLGGLGVTDTPASAGTTELNFNERIGTDDKVFSTGQLDISEHMEGQGQTWLDRLFSDSDVQDPNMPPKEFFNTPNQDDDAMSKEQLAALTKSLETFGTQITELTEAVGKFTAKPEDTETPKQDTKTDPDPVPAEQFSQKMTETLERMESQFSDLEKKFDELLNTETGATETEDSTGAGENEII